jgi:hypothetical protein
LLPIQEPFFANPDRAQGDRPIAPAAQPGCERQSRSLSSQSGLPLPLRQNHQGSIDIPNFNATQSREDGFQQSDLIIRQYNHR